jgi:hypothetical protein
MKRRVIAVVTAVLTMAVLLMVPASGATSWSSKASVNSKGAGYWTTDSTLQTVVEKPYALRLRFRTSNDKSNKVTYSYSVICDKGGKSVYDKTLRTNSDNSWSYVTIYSGTNSLGAFCDVYVSSSLDTTARLRTQIQAKHR